VTVTFGADISTGQAFRSEEVFMVFRDVGQHLIGLMPESLVRA
jgi:hypothetical protein